jgi:hypothetical protein
MPLALNTANVAHETIDGETILIHLGTGTYHSLTGAGPQVWELLAQGLQPQEIVALLQRAHPAEAEQIATSVAQLTDELLAADLLTESPTATVVAPRQIPDALPAAGAFAAPVLETFTDMQDFLLVDPLHDVDEVAGWPHAKAG